MPWGHPRSSAALSGAGAASPALGGEHPALPFARSTVVRTWSLSPGLWLVEVRGSPSPALAGGHDLALSMVGPTPPASSTFYLADRSGVRCVVGPAARAEVRSASPPRIEFVARGADGLPPGVPFSAFPYLLTCDPVTGRTVEEALYLSLDRPVAFGGLSSGHVLAGLDLDQDGLTLRFDPPSPRWPAPERVGCGWRAMGPSAPLWTAPPCTVRLPPDGGPLILRLDGTTAAPGLEAQAAALGGRHALVPRVALRSNSRPAAVEVLLQVEPPAEYSAVCDFGQSRTVTLSIRRAAG
ncbi:MAG: hypothetical protein K6T75_04110 [Acetobacteraceae bacterium]|nr:hypothetical protein [Acetobacteraceae bacterium]